MSGYQNKQEITAAVGVKEEGVSVTTTVDSINVVGPHLTATNVGNAVSITEFAGDILVPATTATLTVTTAHSGALITLDRAAGVTVTLPTATGSGRSYRFQVKTAITSNSYIIKVPNASTIFKGFVLMVGVEGSLKVDPRYTAADSDTITLDGVNQGGFSTGDSLEFKDIATNIFSIAGFLTWDSASFTSNNPFSAAV